MSARDLDLGRRRGLFVPVEEIQAHAACGWILLDDLAGMSDAGDVVLMGPPAVLQQEAVVQ